MTTITHYAPRIGAEMPAPDELRALRRRVLQEHPWLVDPRDKRPEDAIAREFAVSFRSIGFFWRTPSPCHSRYVRAFVDMALDYLELAGLPAIDGSEFFIAALAAGDVVWQRPDPSVGALAELGLDPHRGQPASNRWRDILAGAPLLAPTSPRPVPGVLPDSLPRPTVFQAGWDGRLVNDRGEVW